jgi:hypothetical protein
VGKNAINDECINGDGQERGATRERESERHWNSFFDCVGILQCIVPKGEMLMEWLSMI